MPVDIVVGGQGGDEGKGKICAYLAVKGDYDYSIRVGGPNAGHTIFFNDKIYTLKTMPGGFVNKRARRSRFRSPPERALIGVRARVGSKRKSSR